MRHADRMDGKDVTIDDAKTLYELAKIRAENQMEQIAKEEKEKSQVKPTKFKFKFADSIADSDALFGEAGILEMIEVDEKQYKTPNYIQAGSEEEKRWNQDVKYEKNMVSIIYFISQVSI